jgi:hypothetical protein
MWQVEVENRPVGEEAIVHDVSPLLNCPCGRLTVIDTCTFSPGVAGGHAGVQVNVRLGVGSTLKGVYDPESPLLPVTVIV